MSTCWAASLGGCSGKLSREHIITQGLFLDDEVSVKGFSWCPDQFKKIGIASLVKKALCEAHNSMLSSVDDAGIDTIKAFREAFRLLNVRSQLKSRIWKVKRFSVDGPQLERWFLKTLINIAFGGQFPIGGDSPQPGQPSRILVEIAFGARRFQPRAGLYSIGEVGDKIESGDGVRVRTLVGNTSHLAGARFEFRGFGFLLLLDEEGSTGPFNFVSRDGKELEHSATIYHPRGTRFKVHDRISHIVEINW